MQAIENINLKQLKDAVVSLNNLDFMADVKVPVVGKSKATVRDLFVDTIDALSDAQKKKLPRDVKDMYNFIISDEVEGSAPAPETPMTPEKHSRPEEGTEAPATATKAKGKSKAKAKEAPKAKEKAGPVKADAKGKAKKKGEAEPPEEGETCQIVNSGWDPETKECKYCKKVDAKTHNQCKRATKALEREARKAEKAEKKKPAYSRCHALIDALLHGKATPEALVKRANDLMVKHGGEDNLKSTRRYARTLLKGFRYAGFATKDENNVVAFVPSIAEGIKAHKEANKK
jgi:hypothetical protein